MERQLLLKPEQAAAQLGIGRAKMFELLAAGAIESVKIGRCRRVPSEAVEAYVARLRNEAQAAA